jgi:integrase
MSAYTRPDSKFWYLHLETTGAREKTAILVGTTAEERTDSKRLAESLYFKRMGELGTNVHKLPTRSKDAITFKVYADEYEAGTLANHRGATRERELLVPLRRFFNRHPLTAIDRDLVTKYHNTRKRETGTTGTRKGNNTINREVDLLKSMLRDAAPKHIPASPIAQMPKLETAVRARRPWTPAEEARILKAAADPIDRAVIILGIETLQRLGDLLDLRPIDRRRFWLSIKDPKTGDPYEVPMSKRAAAALDAITPADEKGFYFAKFRRAVNPREWRGSVRQRLERLCKAARVRYGMAHGFTFHGTRKTGATRKLHREGVPVPVVQRLGGWKDAGTLTKFYADVEAADLLAAVGRKRGAR